MSNIVDDRGTPVNGGMPKFVQERMVEKQKKVSICVKCLMNF